MTDKANTFDADFPRRMPGVAESEFLARLFAATDIGIYETGGDGSLRRANPALARMFGYPDAAAFSAALANRPETHYADPEDRARLLERLAQDGEIHEALWQAKRADGSLFWVRESALRIEEPEPRYIGTLTDVTQLVEAWAQVQRAESNYRSMFENASHGIYRSTPEGKQLRANPALVRLNGYATEAELLAAVNDIGTEWYVDPVRRDEFKRRIEEEGRVLDFESEIYRHKTRERIWISESAWAIRGQDGRTLYYEGTVQDITARKRGEQALAEAKAEAERLAEEYRSIFENANFGIYRTDANWRQTRVNPVLAKLNGLDVAEQLAVSRVRANSGGWYVDPNRRTEFRARMARDGRIADFESEIERWSDGVRLWIKENAWAVRDRDGQIVAYEGMIEDITARKRAEMALEEAKAETERLAEDYRSIFENATVGIYRVDAEWNVRAINPALARLNGYESVEDQLATYFKAGGREAWYVEPGRRALFRETLAREGRVSAFESEVTRRADGKRIWVSENAWAVRDRTGKTVAYEGTVEDITARKRAEALLREAKSEAEAASAAKSAFLAVMSHELRTPLNAIIGFAEVVEGRMFGPTDARYFEYAGHIRQSGSHLLTLINDILDLSKIGAGQFELHESEVELGALCDDAVRLFGASAAKAGVALTLETGFPGSRVRADALRLRQVAMNLISNAIKFTPKDGHVRVGGIAGADWVGFWVEDSGIGMTESDAKRAMEPFVQIDDGLARKHGGTGLGLPISKELVALHGGRLIVTSEKGKGTRVAVELPAGRALNAPVGG